MSSPAVMLNDPTWVSAVTEKAVPVRRWQRLHQHIAEPIMGLSTSNFTWPHMQAPVSVSKSPSAEVASELYIA